ncbi:hypothetical protein P3102_03645 [Amycolatopsis sp. QT-25]|nr:hypothetical protein [Amycolatopsis sp. QT-25]WET80355.1 hypothetical protein P3102_03645 [Amycolatopsis sp. QT-25]
MVSREKSKVIIVVYPFSDREIEEIRTGSRKASGPTRAPLAG